MFPRQTDESSVITSMFEGHSCERLLGCATAPPKQSHDVSHGWKKRSKICSRSDTYQRNFPLVPPPIRVRVRIGVGVRVGRVGVRGRDRVVIRVGVGS